MQDAFGIVVISVSVVALVVAVAALASSGRTYDQIGRGRLSIGEDRAPRPAAPGDARERDSELREEVRQLVAARNRRRVANGQEPVDLEAEVSRRLAELGGG